MKKVLMTIIMTGLLLACGSKEEATKEVAKNDTINIGITQIVEHPSLDAIRKGVEDAINESSHGSEVAFDFQNAQGDFATAQTIAEQFNTKSDIIVAITTPSAQAAQNKVSEKPIFFTGVTNPTAAGLEGVANITGVSDMSPVEAQVDLIAATFPNAKKIGTVYNTSEDNSVFLTKKFIEIAEGKGFEVLDRGVTSVNEVATAMDSLKGKVDVIYTTKDNTVAAAYPLIIDKADKDNIPVVGATTDFTEGGATVSAGTSEYAAGYQMGKMVVRYLDGKTIADLPIEYIKDIELTLNEEKAKMFDIDAEKFVTDGGKVVKQK